MLTVLFTCLSTCETPWLRASCWVKPLRRKPLLELGSLSHPPRAECWSIFLHCCWCLLVVKWHFIWLSIIRWRLWRWEHWIGRGHGCRFSGWWEVLWRCGCGSLDGFSDLTDLSLQVFQLHYVRAHLFDFSEQFRRKYSWALWGGVFLFHRSFAWLDCINMSYTGWGQMFLFVLPLFFVGTWNVQFLQQQLIWGIRLEKVGL